MSAHRTTPRTNFLQGVSLAPDGVFLADAQGHCREVNDAGCQILGRTRAEILGKTALDFVIPDDHDAFVRYARAVQATGQGRIEIALQRADGSHIPVELHGRILPSGERQSIVRDIHERREREREQKRQRDVLEWLHTISSLHLSGANDIAILNAILDAAIAITEADFGNIQHVDPSTGDLRILVSRGFSADWLAYWSRVSAGRGVSGTALFVQRARVVVDDVETSPIFVGTPDLDAQRRQGVRAVQSTPLFCRSGEPLGVISTHFRTVRRPSDAMLRHLDLLAVEAADILTQRRKDRALRHAEAFSRGILTASADALISIDGQYRIMAWNPSAERMFGWSQAEALGMSLDELLPLDRRAVHRQHVARFAQEPSIARSMDRRTACGRRKNGEEFPIEATLSRLELDGELILTVAVRDVTEQRRQEEEQRLLADLGGAMASADYEDTLSQIVRVATQWLADHATLLLFDDGGSQLYRAAASTRDPALAWTAESMMQLPLQGELSHPALQVIREQKPLVVELDEEQYPRLAQSPQHLRALMAAKPRSVLFVPLIALGRCIGALGLGRQRPSYDARDLKLAETMAQRCALHIENARLYRAERRATRARDEVLQIVAHDLRNPLNAVGLQLQSLLRQRASEDRWQEPALRIRESLARMNQMIQDLLDVTRLEAGALSITLGPLDPGQILREVVETQQAAASDAGIELRCEAACGCSPVLADHRRLHQVFQNLIGNALKFTPSGGSITIGAVALEQAVEFSVRDTGSGIPAQHIPHLFDRFWQADRADHRGAGLGLAIVRGLALAHGGNIRVESSEGQGTAVFFSIPLAKRPSE